MGILEDVVINTKSAFNTLSKKAGEFVDVSKLKINVTEIENEVSKSFEKIGKLVYESKKEGTDLQKNEIDTIISHMDNLFLKLENLHKQIASIQKKCKCNDCGFLNEIESIYCCKCGAKLDCQCSTCCCEPEQCSTTDNAQNCSCEPCDCTNASQEDDPTNQPEATV